MGRPGRLSSPGLRAGMAQVGRDPEAAGFLLIPIRPHVSPAPIAEMRKGREREGFLMTGMKKRARAVARVAPVMLMVLLTCAPALRGQRKQGSAGDALGGAVIGAYSGAAMGLVGAFGPCNRTLSGVRCPRVAAAIGGALGLASGIWMGVEDPEGLYGRWRGAGYGALVGGVVGYALSMGVRQYGWGDAAAFLAVGAGIGASPCGAGIGFVSGAALGTLGWMVIPEMKIGDAVALSLLGMGVGGLAGWVTGMGGGGEPQPLLVPLQFRFR